MCHWRWAQGSDLLKDRSLCAAADLLDNGVDEKDFHSEPDWGQLVTFKNSNLRCHEKALFDATRMKNTASTHELDMKTCKTGYCFQSVRLFSPFSHFSPRVFVLSPRCPPLVLLVFLLSSFCTPVILLLTSAWPRLPVLHTLSSCCPLFVLLLVSKRQHGSTP